ncbi:MAG: prephenate dehydratase domain-containing protein [Bacteroidota bacterium]
MNKTVAIQGLKGSFHHEAANHYFGQEIDLSECETFAELVKSVTRKEAHFGVMAIENSLAGSILQNYGLLRKEDVEIIGEVGLRVKMNVMALHGVEEDEIAEIHSHQMAIRQCGSFFDQYPSIKVVEAFDTAGSAKYIAERQLPNVAAIASELAAMEYNLNIIHRGIEDHDLNYTRFLIIQPSNGPKVDMPEKVSVYFQTKNDPGSLAHTLTIISGLGINLGKLQSHPVPSKNSLYGFFANLEIDELEQLEDLKKIMQRMALAFEILGIYKKGQTHG